MNIQKKSFSSNKQQDVEFEIINISNQDDEYDQLLRENEILRRQNIQIKNESEIVTNNLLQKLQVKEDELTQLRQSQTTLYDTLQDVQNHNEIQMFELEKSKRSFNDLERINQELYQKSNDQPSSQQQDIQLIELNKDLLAKGVDIDILHNQIQKLNQKHITFNVKIDSQQQLINDLKLNAEVCKGKNDKNVQNLECIIIQLNNDFLEDHLIQNNENSRQKVQINQMKQSNSDLNRQLINQCVPPLQQVELNQSIVILEEDERIFDSQQASIPSNIIVEHNDSIESYDILPSRQIIATLQVESEQSIVIPDEDDILIESQQVPLRPTRIPRQQNRNPTFIYIKIVKKIKRNSPN